MNSLWLSLTDGTDEPAIHEAIHKYLEGWLTPYLVRDALTLITDLVGRLSRSDGHTGELILSRHDNSLLIEVVDRPEHPAQTAGDNGIIDGLLQVPPLLACTWGTHSANIGTLVWVVMPLDSVSPR